MDVSIIIVNYNTARMLLDCISSVKEHSQGCSYEIIVVDNGSQDTDVLLLRSDDRFHLIESKENLGYGQANNLGSQYATGDYLLLLNPDTLLRNNAVDILYQYISHNDNCGICGGNIYYKDGKHGHSYHVWFPSILSEIDFATAQILRKIKYGKSVQFNYTGRPKNVAMITGADLMIRHDIWNKANGFDSRFFMYCEDADLCYRVKKLGYHIMSVPQAEIIHLEGQSFKETETHCKRILDGRNHYFHKHYSKTYNTISDFLNLFTIDLGIIVCSVLGRKQKKEDLTIRKKVYKNLLQKQ